MSKNNKKTINERTHNSFGIYKSPNEPKEEFAADFNSKSTHKNSVNKGEIDKKTNIKE